MSAATNPGGEALQRLTPENCVFLICDVQAKFAPVIHKFGAVVAGAERMRCARVRVHRVVRLPAVA